MLPLYCSSILKLEHKTDNGTKSSDHLHQHPGAGQQVQQKACDIHAQNQISNINIRVFTLIRIYLILYQQWIDSFREKNRKSIQTTII